MCAVAPQPPAARLFANAAIAAIAASRVGSRPCAAACVAVVAARPHPGAACGAPGDQEDAA